MHWSMFSRIAGLCALVAGNTQPLPHPSHDIRMSPDIVSVPKGQKTNLRTSKPDYLVSHNSVSDFQKERIWLAQLGSGSSSIQLTIARASGHMAESGCQKEGAHPAPREEGWTDLLGGPFHFLNPSELSWSDSLYCICRRFRGNFSQGYVYDISIPFILTPNLLLEGL